MAARGRGAARPQAKPRNAVEDGGSRFGRGVEGVPSTPGKVAHGAVWRGAPESTRDNGASGLVAAALQLGLHVASFRAPAMERVLIGAGRPHGLRVVSWRARC